MRGMEFQPDSTTSKGLQVFFGQEDNQADELRRIASLVDAWLMAQYQARPDFESARRRELTLHAAIKTSSLYGMILSFAGLNIWVNARTPDGIVEFQETINL